MSKLNRLLVVDDELTNRRLLRVALSNAGYDVLEAADGGTAISLAREGRPDLILMDVVMPGQDGFATCADLRSHPETARIPIIFVTGTSQPGDVAKAFAAGASDFLTKDLSKINFADQLSRDSRS